MPGPTTVDPHTPGGRIRMLRKAFGLNQQALGKIVGASQQSVSFWETNRVIPSDDSLRHLAVALHTTPYFLYPDRFLAGVAA